MPYFSSLWRPMLPSSASSYSSRILVCSYSSLESVYTHPCRCSTDIERTYSERKLIAKRKPISPSKPRPVSSASASSAPTHSRTSTIDSVDLSTPAATDAPTDTDTEADLDATFDEMRSTPIVHASKKPKQKRQAPSGYDLLNRFFRKDAIGVKNIDLLRYVKTSFHNPMCMSSNQPPMSQCIGFQAYSLNILRSRWYIRPSAFPTSYVSLAFQPRTFVAVLPLFWTWTPTSRAERPQVPREAFHEALLLSGGCGCETGGGGGSLFELEGIL